MSWLLYIVWYKGPISFLPHMYIQFYQYRLLKRLPLPHCVYLVPLLKINWSYMYRFISGHSVQFPWFIYLFLPWNHRVFITIALWYILKSRSMIPPWNPASSSGTCVLQLKVTVEISIAQAHKSCITDWLYNQVEGRRNRPIQYI